MSYGANFLDLFRRSADLVDKILHGANPDDLPVAQPVKFDLAINLKTARCHRYFYSRGAAGPCRRGHRIEDIFVAARESRRGGEDYGNRFCVLRCYYLLYPYEHCRRSRGLKSMGDTPWPTAKGSCCIRD